MQVVMTEGDHRSAIIRFAVPVFVGYLFQQLYNTIDALIVGNFVGGSALAAVSSTSSLIYLTIGFFMGFSTGAGVIVARAIGAGQREEIERSVHTSLCVGLICGAAATVIGASLSVQALSWMGTPPDVMEDAGRYLRIYFSGAFALVMYNMLVSIMQAAGDSAHPLVYLIISSLANIILDLLFVAVFGMGVSGAALATILSQALSMVLAFVHITRSTDSIRVRLSCLSLHGAVARDIVSNGLPAGLQMAIVDLSNVLIQSYINSFGSAAMAGIGAACRIEGFAFLPVSAFSIAVTTFISQNMGARQPERVWRGMRFGLICSVCVIEILGLLMVIFAPHLIRMFNAEPAVVRYGVGRMRICAGAYCLMGFTHVSSAVMRGLKRPIVPTAVMLGCWCALRVLVLATIGARVHDIRLTYWIYPFTWTVSSVVYGFLIVRLKPDRIKREYMDINY